MSKRFLFFALSIFLLVISLVVATEQVSYQDELQIKSFQRNILHILRQKSLAISTPRGVGDEDDDDEKKMVITASLLDQRCNILTNAFSLLINPVDIELDNDESFVIKLDDSINYFKSVKKSHVKFYSYSKSAKNYDVTSAKEVDIKLTAGTITITPKSDVEFKYGVAIIINGVSTKLGKPVQLQSEEHTVEIVSKGETKHQSTFSPLLQCGIREANFATIPFASLDSITSEAVKYTLYFTPKHEIKPSVDSIKIVLPQSDFPHTLLKLISLSFADKDDILINQSHDEETLTITIMDDKLSIPKDATVIMKFDIVKKADTDFADSDSFNLSGMLHYLESVEGTEKTLDRSTIFYLESPQQTFHPYFDLKMKTLDPLRPSITGYTDVRRNMVLTTFTNLVEPTILGKLSCEFVDQFVDQQNHAIVNVRLSCFPLLRKDPQPAPSLETIINQTELRNKVFFDSFSNLIAEENMVAAIRSLFSEFQLLQDDYINKLYSRYNAPILLQPSLLNAPRNCLEYDPNTSKRSVCTSNEPGALDNCGDMRCMALDFCISDDECESGKCDKDTTTCKPKSPWSSIWLIIIICILVIVVFTTIYILCTVCSKKSASLQSSGDDDIHLDDQLPEKGNYDNTSS